MGRRLLRNAFGALRAAADAARHVAWYVSYQVDGNARSEEESAGSEPARGSP